MAGMTAAGLLARHDADLDPAQTLWAE